MKLHYLMLAIGLALSVSSWAQEAVSPAEAEKTVEVSAAENPALRPYRIMTRGLDAFDKHHALAPKAALRFEWWNQLSTLSITTA